MKNVFVRIIVSISVVLILLIAQSKSMSITTPLRGIVGNVVNPLIYNINFIVSSVSDIFSKYIFLVGVREENEKYRELIQQLSFENIMLTQSLKEYDNMFKLSRMGDSLKYDYVAARVVGKDAYGYISQLVIDKGARDNISVDDVVISDNGLVGIISEVSPTTSLVSTILNMHTYIAIENERTSENGIIHGNGNGRLVVEYYDILDSVAKDDKIISSGIGLSGRKKLLFSGVPIGKVAYVDRPMRGLFQTLTVEPSVNFNKLKYVLVVKVR